MVNKDLSLSFLGHFLSFPNRVAFLVSNDLRYLCHSKEPFHYISILNQLVSIEGGRGTYDKFQYGVIQVKIRIILKEFEVGVILSCSLI
ncbi:hypothetical protein A9255_19335 [Xenorhabdus hominickii]|uniref:Uncharacterized protein n=1 Tax=Xenorhabdus hominickii TaxID=351679 RepID=A0A2G0Q4C0_XENHO|nr:hypothetical protein A9255_19335 [Xenorhabdus hominickii]PHM54063.1 hypothetical protein Xhom_03133 [Xenorhabdus hominickii]